MNRALRALTLALLFASRVFAQAGTHGPRIEEKDYYRFTPPVTVTATIGTATADYNTLKAAFDAINAGTHKGAIGISITGNTTETASATLNGSGGASSYTSVTIQPQGAIVVIGTLAAPLVDLNGADNVTIDGGNSGGNSLQFQNNSTSPVAGTSAIRMINGATGNTVTRCTLLGSTLALVGTAGGVVVNAGGSANSNNTVSYCKVGPAGANLPSVCITNVNGATSNNNFSVLNNEIYDFYNATGSQAGIYLAGGSGFAVVQGNRIYQTAPRVLSGGTTQTVYGILYFYASSRCTIANNVIGFANASGTGLMTYTATSALLRPIMISGSNANLTASSISGNTISGIDFTSSRVASTIYNAAFVGIDAGMTSNLQANTDIGANGGNTIGSLDGSSSIHITMNGVGNPVANLGIARYMITAGGSISNNHIGSIVQDGGPGVVTGGFTGIMVNYNASNVISSLEVTDNVIGGTAAGSITNNIAGNAPVYGIHASSAGTNARRNTVRNLLAHHASGTTPGVAGLVATSIVGARGIGFQSNTIYGLVNDASASGQGYTDGIYFNMSINNGGTADRNLVSGLSGISAGSSFVSGIRIANTGNVDLSNNMVSLGRYEDGSVYSTDAQLNGIWDAGTGTNTLYHNSIYIGGSDASSTESNGMLLSSASGSRTVRNNILFTARTNSGGSTGSHYAFQSYPGTPFSSDYNDLFVTGGILARYNGADYASLAALQAASGQEAHSISADPGYLNAAAPSATVDLHVPGANRFLAVGTYTTYSDFDGQTRSTTTPSIGADETCEVPTLNYTVTDACTGSNNGAIDLSTTGGTTPFSFAWTNSNSYSSNTEDISGLAAGTYAVTVTTPGGCSVSATGIVVGTAGPSTASIVYNGSPFCDGTGLRAVTRTGTAGGTYSAPAGLSIDASTGAINLDASTAGTYTVTYAYGGICNGVATTPVTVAPVGAQLFINPLPNQLYCAGDQSTGAVFTSSTGLQYSWHNDNTSIGIGASGTGAMPSFTTQNSGTSLQTGVIAVTATASNGCTYKTMVFRISVKPVPQVNQPSSQVLCAGSTTSAVAFTSSLPGTVFSWTNNNTSTGLNAAGTGNLAPFVAVNNTGSVQQSTIAVTPVAAGCTGAASSFTLTVSPAAGSIFYPSAATLCPSGTVNVQHRGSTGGVYSATPAGLSINPATGALNLGASLPNTYTVSYTVPSLGGCSGLATTSVTINSQAVVAAEPNQTYCNGVVTPPTVFNGTAASYTWTNDNPSIGLAASGTGNLPSFTTVNPGPGAQTAYIRVTPQGNGNGVCPGKTMAFRITVENCPPVTHNGGTGGDPATGRSLLQVSPNPAQGPLTLTVSEAGAYSVQVLSNLGLPLTRPETFTGNRYGIDLAGLRPGVYVLQLVNQATGTATRTLVTKL